MPRPLNFLLPVLLLAHQLSADVTLESEGFRMVLNDGARWESLWEKATTRELCDASAKLSFATMTVEGKTIHADSAALDSGRLRVGFAGGATTVVYAVQPSADWLRFTVESLEGQRPDRLWVAQAPIAITQNVGRRLDIAWDEITSVCLMSANQQTGASGGGKTYALLRTYSQDAPGPKLEGASAALIVCPTPRIREVLRRASNEFGLLTSEIDGVPVKDTDLGRGSYWFLTFGESEVDKVIDLCKRTGFTQVMMGFGSWCTSAGHYTFNTSRYPDGEASLKRTIDKLHAEGILVGMHTFASKVAKRDPYVTPIPDRRFWVDRQTKLAAAVTPVQTEVRVAGDLREWAGSPVAKQKFWEGGVTKHQEVLLDDEIIRYQSIGPEGTWDTFLGCERGAWGTTAGVHGADTAVRHYGVDGCINGYIIDQETDLLEEVTTRLAGIFNGCGFDMIYFDGGEDVPRTRFNYYVTKFQETLVRKIDRPIIHMGTIMTHRLWHSFARSATVDNYLNTLRGALLSGREIGEWPTVRDHIDRSVKRVIDYRQDLMPGELGWFGIWPKQENTDGLQLDEIEYLMAKSLAYDAPISLQTGFSTMEAHPLTPQILEIVRAYEELRMKRAVPADTVEPMKERGKDFVLLQSVGEAEFVQVEPVASVGGGRDVRALVGEREGGAVATLWHYVKDGTVTLAVDPAKLRARDFSGQTVEIEKTADGLRLPVDSRRLTLYFDGMTKEEAKQALAEATVRTRQAQYLWLQAEDAVRIEGEMALGSEVGVKEGDTFGDVLVCTGKPSPQQPNEWFAEYQADIPRQGRWTLWARVRYPTGTDVSFAVLWPGETLTLGSNQALGNCGVGVDVWHWTGRGGGSTSAPPGQPISVTLPKGEVTFRVYAREGTGSAKTNPRLDLLCLTDDASVVPTDEMARAATAE